MFEAILFDFDGTLVNYVNSDIKSLKRLHAHADATVCFEDFMVKLPPLLIKQDTTIQNQ